MEPRFNDYVALIYNRYAAFVQSSEAGKKLGHPYDYENQSLLVFFLWMQCKQIYAFKNQWNWLKKHPEALEVLSWQGIPDRSTLSRRYKVLYSIIQELIAFLGQSNAPLGEELSSKHLNEDQSLFKAQGQSGIKVTVSKVEFLRNCGI
jgi:hypothetical protein